MNYKWQQKSSKDGRGLSRSNFIVWTPFSFFSILFFLSFPSFFFFLIQIVSRIFVFFFLKREHTLRNYFEHFERTQEEDIGTLDFRFLSFKI